MKMSRRTTLPWWAAFFILAATAAAAVAAEDEESAAFLSRHRREPDPLSDAAEARSRRLQEEQKQNRFKPEFRGCEDYDPKVPEESPRGTQVIQVYATDKDGPDGPNGQVLYSIVSQHNKFTIDPKTGWLSTAAIFNRDEPQREKLVHVTVKATDQGRPQLEDVCTLAIKIKDINDNAPVFDRASYVVALAQDMEVGDMITRISATDVDEGDNQRITYDLKSAASPINVESDIDYFKCHYQTGVVTLNQKLDKPINYVFQLLATATDSGNPPKSSSIHVTLDVKESSNKAPKFETGPGSSIDLPEGYSDFGRSIANYTARSNIPGDETVFFQLVRGRTEQTNKDDTFRALQSQDRPNAVHIYLAKPLQYERVSQYTLTLQVRNSPDLVEEALLHISVQDENNQAPVFTNVESGNVLEHEPPGTIVMQVSAIDNDGTFPNNKVTYAISERNAPDIKEKFSIDEDTGVITTNEEFDREERPVYALTIDAIDGAPSSLLKNGRPNVTPQKFRIAIADTNDNPPYFKQSLYRAEVPEDQDVGSKVIEVRAEDKDEEASITTYQIDSGNQGNAFRIEEQTGFIRVAKQLDYETISKYTLVINAWDGQFSNMTTVEIIIQNRNDMKPRFKKDKYVVYQEEERIPSAPVVTVEAVDPDIGDESVDQNITYYLDRSSDRASYFSIDERTGDVRIIKPLDRDAPDGFPTWNLYIFAKDMNGGPDGIENYVELVVELKDINDNAPYLDMGDGLVWTENQGIGEIGVLVADDYDTPEKNGPPFSFELDPAARDVRQWFEIKRLSNGTHVLEALVTFDREQRKTYDVPIKVCDRKGECAVDSLTVTIGDVNDNLMESGSSSIFVYNYEGLAPDTEIGRVFVEDPDDWDLPDKRFKFKDRYKWPDFALDEDTGMIIMKRGIQLDQELNTYFLEFLVEDEKHRQIGPAAVSATVNVTVQRIPKEAVVKSGSLRIRGRPEDFIVPDASGVSKRDRFKTVMSKYLNATFVDVFTVLDADVDDDEDMTDVRFSAHGSPYLAPEKLEGVLTKRKADLSASLGLDIAMIHVDACMDEEKSCNGGSCYNHLKISEEPVLVRTNRTSFVGVQARTVAHCACSAPPGTEPSSCSDGFNPCLNGGECRNVLGGYECDCPADNPDFFGRRRCERLAASFNGQGWSWQPGLPACGNSHLSLHFNTQYEYGTLLYVGPSPYNVVSGVTDFMALEVYKGKLRLFVNFGDGTRILELEQKVADGEDHYVALRWTNDTIQIELDSNACSNEISPKRNQCFLQITTHDMRKHFLNTNGPLHVGGVSFGSDRFQQVSDLLGLDRKEMPDGAGFAGCIRNLTFSAAGKITLYDLGSPSDGESFTPGCDDEFVQAVTATGLNTNFLIAIIVCLLVILIAVIILAVYRRRRHVFGDKDMDCDIRENIINYEDEGGGEGDQTGYDLSVLRMMSDGTPALHAGDPSKKGIMQESPPDIQTFLQTNKDRIDGDPDATPYDDLRHYAYEGDGNSGAGSLSSLNSGTSDADLEFHYLHDFGPRFKKLADMYGPDSDESDEDDDVDDRVRMPPPLPPQRQPLPHHYQPQPGNRPPSESWC